MKRKYFHYSLGAPFLIYVYSVSVRFCLFVVVFCCCAVAVVVVVVDFSEGIDGMKHMS